MILLHLLVLSCDGTQPGGPDLAAGPQLKKRHPGGGGQVFLMENKDVDSSLKQTWKTLLFVFSLVGWLSDPRQATQNICIENRYYQTARGRSRELRG